jgi:hypothetical protein
MEPTKQNNKSQSLLNSVHTRSTNASSLSNLLSKNVLKRSSLLCACCCVDVVDDDDDEVVDLTTTGISFVAFVVFVVAVVVVVALCKNTFAFGRARRSRTTLNVANLASNSPTANGRSTNPPLLLFTARCCKFIVDFLPSTRTPYATPSI